MALSVDSRAGKRKEAFLQNCSRHQERRREDFLKRSRQARSDALAKARVLVEADCSVQEPEPEGERSTSCSSSAADGAKQARADAQAKARAHFASQLMPWERMIEVPASLGRNWRVLARPEGKRCLLIASRAASITKLRRLITVSTALDFKLSLAKHDDDMRTQTVSRLKTGAILHVFASALPNGSRKTRRPNKCFCVLDSVWHEPQQTYYVLDVMVWNGIYLYGCSLDCRSHWTESHLQASDAALDPFPGHQYRLASVKLHVCDDCGLAEAYAGDCPFQRDGLLFMHKETPYVLESNPYVLLWKDAACSRWPIDTDKNGVVPPHQEVVLAYRPDGTLVTGDASEGVVLGRMPSQVIESVGHKMRDGLLLRFTLGEGGVQIGPNGQPTGADLEWVGVAHHRRGSSAHLFSRIVSQWQMRTHPIEFDALMAAVRAHALVHQDEDDALQMCDDDMSFGDGDA